MNGWQSVEHHEERNDAKKLHDCLKPYKRLPDREHKKDKDAVRNYISIIKKAD